MPSVQAIIADDHPLFRSALKQAAAQAMADEPILEASDLLELFSALVAHPEIELVFLDLTIPGAQGLEGLARLRNQYPDILVIMVSANEHPSIIEQAMALGASAYIPKSSSLDVISEAIAQVIEGENWLPPQTEICTDVNSEQAQFARNLEKLTPQQYRVLSMIADGMLNKQIAYAMSIQETTIKQHVSAILKKLNVYNRTQAGILFKQMATVAESEEA
ncbi:response regulator transcription factor [Pseudoalteromonas sp. BDTF-M6]|uniref:response regulator n=1 Tax=Pseudoalteromonas sp. BDTF-M6 TaxID=2796132 RepID=UPI001BAF472D|nr:response regulator transcription factor [Pseudoalteromonas sp. BDTF-M6]MBS3797121.1 response regulator transcription factor [Pseudoalteromonas sp. BDTF-M6]